MKFSCLLLLYLIIWAPFTLTKTISARRMIASKKPWKLKNQFLGFSTCEWQNQWQILPVFTFT